MTSFCERYCNGEHEAVWEELIALGDAVRDSRYFPDAVAVAQQIVHRSCQNLQVLHERLLGLGYEFADPENALRMATPSDLAQLDSIEKRFGPGPIIFRVWYETIGSVNFSQSAGQLQCPELGKPEPGPDVFGLGSHPVLIFLDLRESLRSWEEEYALFTDPEHAREREILRGYPIEEEPEPEAVMFLGGCASTCEGKGFELPNLAIDGVIYDDGAGDTFFVQELREAFRWGGFPFWKRSLEDEEFYSPGEYRPNFARLLPILNRDLIAV
jgi:hypothetical protein